MIELLWGLPIIIPLIVMVGLYIYWTIQDRRERD